MDSHSHLPEIAVNTDALHPIVRILVEAGGGTFRRAPKSGHSHGVPLLCGNALYPFALYLTESDKGLAPAAMNSQGELVPVLLLKDLESQFPTLARAYVRAIRRTPNLLPAA
jgi:hypothetical protein